MFSYSRRGKPSFSKIGRQRRRKLIGTFESLEDRRLLTTFHVTTTADLLDPADGKLSLREAIDLANAHPGADTIVLKAGPNAYKITIAGAGEDNNATGDFDILDDLTIKSAGSGFPTIGGNGLDRVLNIPTGFDGVSLTLNHVIVTGGIAHGNGGGVAGESNDNTLTFINTTIKNNISTSPGGGFGGGVYNESGDVNVLSNSHVNNNSAAAGITGAGGGIFLNNGAGAITIKKSTVNGNSAYGLGGGIGTGAIGDFTVTDSQINNNHAGDNGGGGAAVAVTSATITNSTISGNTTSGIGGGFFEDNGVPITIRNSKFINNSAVRDGGAVWTSDGTMSISGSTFKDNTTAGSGGAIAEVAAVQVTDSTFNHNVAQDAGGAIWQDDEGNVTILRSTFTKNSSVGGEGGAIYAFGNSASTIDVTDSKFTFNSAGTDGGAIMANGTVTNVIRSIFDHNTAVTGFGGALETVPLTATDSKFTYNTAKADGGAFNSEGSNITLVRCLVSCNTATNGRAAASPTAKSPARATTSSRSPIARLTATPPAATAADSVPQECSC